MVIHKGILQLSDMANLIFLVKPLLDSI